MAPRHKKTKHRLFIVDDHPMMRHGLAQFLSQEDDFALCGEASNKSEALEAIAIARPDLAIVDISLPGHSGLELIKDLCIQAPDVPVLVHSMHDENIFAERALRAGAQGYVMKQESGRELIMAIRRVLAGKIYLSSNCRSISRRKDKTKPGRAETPISSLTDRELEVFHRIGSGLSNQEIAGRLHLSIKTVDAHREHIKRKLRLRTTTELNLFAVRWVASQAAC